ncbi:MAG: hypothetical protein SGARI_001887 [Bacillariaceae sp.]
MKRATKRPSEWLKLLCKDWAEENLQLVESTDHKFLQYKPYLKGFLTSQLLCRLCIPTGGKDKDSSSAAGNAVQGGGTTAVTDGPPFDFWRMLNIQDEFDKAYIIAQVERFCTLYQIRNALDINPSALSAPNTPEAAAAAAAAAVAAANGNFLSPDATAAAVAAAQLASGSNKTAGDTSPVAGGSAHRLPMAMPGDAVIKAQRVARDAERALEQERKQSAKREQKRQTQERKLEKQREREQQRVKKKAEKIAREQTREEKRKKKLELREQRERFVQEQKEAALKRAAELVASNRVPIEITRGAAAAKEAADRALKQLGATTTITAGPVTESPEAAPVAPADPQQGGGGAAAQPKKQRSAIVVSTASDLNQIVTHSKNLWAKYNAIAKEHNQRVNWITVAKELGIHVKVREKYARMHSRAEQRGFDWKVNGHFKIKDHPEIFMEPTQAERKSRMPPPSQFVSRTVMVTTDFKPPHEPPPLPPAPLPSPPAAVAQDHSSHDAALAAAAVVDATGVVDPMVVPDPTRLAAAKREQEQHDEGVVV